MTPAVRISVTVVDDSHVTYSIVMRPSQKKLVEEWLLSKAHYSHLADYMLSCLEDARDITPTYEELQEAYAVWDRLVLVESKEN